MDVLVLCCHTGYFKIPLSSEFQRPAEIPVYQKHLVTAFQLLRRYDILVISGGYTNPSIEISEAKGYLEWAVDKGIISRNKLYKLSREKKILLEEFARSSVENLLFAMLRTYQVFQEWPLSLHAITLQWKKKWFEEIIAPCLKLPKFKVLETPFPDEKKEKLIEIGGIFPDPQMVAESNREDPLEFQRGQERDFWKKGNPYESQFPEIFHSINNQKIPTSWPWEQGKFNKRGKR